jgi:hypothetical protein
MANAFGGRIAVLIYSGSTMIVTAAQRPERFTNLP